MVCITHGVFLLGICEYSLNALFTLPVEHPCVLVLADFLSQVQILLPDVGGQQLLPLLVRTAPHLARASCAIFRCTAVGAFSILVRSGMAQDLALWTSKLVFHRIIGIVPGLVSVSLSGGSGVGQNGDPAVIKSLLCDPGGLVACVHRYELYFMLRRYFVIYLVPRNTVMDIACGHFHAQDEAVFIAGGMGFIGKLPLMLAFYEHSAVRVCGRNGLFLRLAAPGWLGIIVIIAVLNGLLTQLLAFRIHFFPELSGIDLSRFCDLLLLELLLVGAGLDVGSIDKNNTGIDHAVVERLVQDMLENFTGQLLRKPLAEGIAYRGKVRDLVQQTIAQEPPVSQIHLDLPVSLAQGRDAEQVLDEYHLDKHHRVRTGSAVVVAVQRVEPLIQPVVIHDLLNLAEQMILGHQRIQIDDDRLPPCVVFPLFHKNTPISFSIYETGAFG